MSDPGNDMGLSAPLADVHDADALDRIAEWLKDPEWAPGMLEDIADMVRATGRVVENYPDDRPTWDRH